MSAERIGHAWRVAAALGVAALLAVFAAGAVRSTRGPHRVRARHFNGAACLPLSGDLGFAGNAFREGFSAGLDSAPDSLFDWTWTWRDNEGDPAVAQAFVRGGDSGRSADLLLVGMSTVAAGLPPCPKSCLVLDDGGEHPPDPNRWDLWTPSSIQRCRILGLLRACPPPWTIVVEATGSWTEPVFPALSDSLPKLQVILHDPDNSRWEEAVSQILAQRPKTILFWDAPPDASTLLSRRLAWPVFRTAAVWVPEGTAVPSFLHADTLHPLWQVIPGTAPGPWKLWGMRCGRALAASSRLRVLDSIPDWTRAFARVPSETARQTGPAGWYPTEH